MGYYQETKPTCIIDVLGTPYSVYMDSTEQNDPMLEKCDGYCDKTVRRVVVRSKSETSDLEDYSVYAKKNLRHEIIHAFMFESGLDGNSIWENGDSDHPEQVVEWMAVQFQKIRKAFVEAGAL